MKYWTYLEEDGVAAHQGLATDEFMIEQCKTSPEATSILRLYTYKNYCALVGRYQHIEAELDLATCEREGVQFGRRLTGGGAIIMGQDQLGLCIAVSPSLVDVPAKELYRRYAQPLINALASLGIQASLRSKNDLEVKGKKIAGLGVYLSLAGAMQFHASILLDLDITQMLRVLNIPLQKIADKKQIHSVEQRITTISRELGRKPSLSELRQLIKQAYASHFEIKLQPHSLTASDKARITKIAQQRYLNKAWIHQRSPRPDMNGMGLKKTPAGLIRAYVALKGDTLKSVLITGDFFQHGDLFNQIESALKWSPLDKAKISQVIEQSFEKAGTQASGLLSSHITEVILRAGRKARTQTRAIHYEGSCYYPEIEQRQLS